MQPELIALAVLFLGSEESAIAIAEILPSGEGKSLRGGRLKEWSKDFGDKTFGAF